MLDYSLSTWREIEDGQAVINRLRAFWRLSASCVAPKYARRMLHGQIWASAITKCQLLWRIKIIIYQYYLKSTSRQKYWLFYSQIMLVLYQYTLMKICMHTVSDGSLLIFSHFIKILLSRINKYLRSEIWHGCLPPLNEEIYRGILLWHYMASK